ncbi:LysE family translocator [bacterium]|nr:LysE family translocator [bacterium]
MPDTSTLTAFSVAALILFVVPGPAVLYVVSRSMTGGRKAGLVSVLGLHAGSVVYVIAAMAGLTAILVRSTAAFTAVKWAGALYLIYLGVRTLLADDDADDLRTVGEGGLRRAFTQGFIVNLLNPKTAIFFVAFVPQFVDPAEPPPTQILVLGILFIILGTLSDSAYALVAGSVGSALQEKPAWRRGRRWVSGAIYLALGVAAAISGGRAEGA